MSSDHQDESLSLGEQVLQSVTARRCCRSFSPEKVPIALVESLLSAVRCVPSSQNSQPWSVEVVTGEPLASFSSALLKAFDEVPAAEIKPDYRNRATALPEPMAARVADYGKTYYDHLGLARDDEKGRRDVTRRNYCFFGAPLHLILHLDAKSAVEGTFLDAGIFLGTLLTAAAAFQLGACPQFSVAKYPDVVRKCLGLSEERLIVCGISLGYPTEEKINSYKPSRASLSEFVTWHQ